MHTILETPFKVCQLARLMEHSSLPPTIPDVTDEAGDTPPWVPWLGAGLFAAFLGYVWFL